VREAIEFLERGVRDGVFPSAQLLVAEAGRVLLYDAAGAATTSTPFDLASLTKPLATTLLAMHLHDRGVLDLDAPVPQRPEVTARQLLSHSAGFPAHRRYWEDPRAKTRADFFALAAREPLEFPPGSQSVYSDVGFLVLGALVEQLGCATLDRQLFALEPRGPQYPTAPLPDAAPTEGDVRGIVHDENARAMGGVAPHAGLFGDAHDVHVRLLAINQLISARTRALFFTAQPNTTWGLGWDHPSPPPAYSSAGSRFPRSGVGHLAFTGCSIWMDPARAFWIILLSNRIHPSRDNQKIRAFRPLLHDAVLDLLTHRT
jgi:CubicO group peptidase (beta-lactamase class C family)